MLLTAARPRRRTDDSHSAVNSSTPVKPFYFDTSKLLLRITTQRGDHARRVAGSLARLPAHSIFQHTFGTLQSVTLFVMDCSNAFAHWVLADCNQPGLAEQLASARTAFDL
jgi:hypothetical protein